MSNIKKVGFIDKTGKIVIPPMEVDFNCFSDGLAVFTSPQGKMGAINKSGEVVIQPIYDQYTLSDFKNGRAIFKEGDEWGLLDAAGNVVVEPIYSSLTGPDEFGNYRATKDSMVGDSMVGFIDCDGNVIIDFTFEDWQIPRVFFDGYAAACSDAGWGFIDNTGKWVIEPQPQYCRARSFGEGLAPVQLDNTHWQYINIKNEVQFKIETTCYSDDCGSFKGGVAFIDNYLKKRPINKKGEFINKARYDFVDDWYWAEGPIQVCVSLGGDVKFLKPDGKYVKFEGIKAKDRIRAGNFREGLVSIENRQTGTTHFYDVNGKIFPTPELKSATSFSEGLAICTTVDSQDIILDREGNIVCTLPKIAEYVSYHIFSEGLAMFEIDEEI
jgi:hypothetical protein